MTVEAESLVPIPAEARDVAGDSQPNAPRPETDLDSEAKDGQGLIEMKAEPPTTFPEAERPSPRAYGLNVGRDLDPNLQEAAHATEWIHQAEGRPEVVAPAGIEPHGLENDKASRTSENTENEGGTSVSPTGLPAPPRPHGVSRVPTPEPGQLIAVPGIEAKEAPKYPGPRPAPSAPKANKRERQPLKFPADQDSELHMHVHLVFGRRGGSMRLSVIPEWHLGLPDELEVTGTQGDFACCRLEKFYEDVAMPDIGQALRGGVSWRGKGALQRCRWVLGGRQIYVLARGDDVGLCGFISVTRLLLGAEHVVLATKESKADVLAALSQAGCAEPVIMDETMDGVPGGWLMFRGVQPTRPVQTLDEADILNALRPVADISPQFVGGIRLGGRTWLLGHPPCIRFTGDTSSELKVKIDGEPASVSSDGGYITPGWDSEGRHSLWFAGHLRKYLLRRGAEQWEAWSAHNFGTGATFCGPRTMPQNEARCHQVRVPIHNPVLIGAVPGQIFRCNVRTDVRNDFQLTFVPFAPVWALPADPLHADKRSARIMLVGKPQSVQSAQVKRSGIAAWCAVIRDAGYKRLPLATEEQEVAVLWRAYRRAAKQLWRKMR